VLFTVAAALVAMAAGTAREAEATFAGAPMAERHGGWTALAGASARVGPGTFLLRKT
jgi:hypothetical protein